MKKTMFITSVIMVVVMAIALTTSSLAWFTASGANTVTTNTLQLKATTATASGIQISSVSGDEAFGLSINLASAAIENMMPLVPVVGSSDTLATALGAESNNVAAPAFVGNKVVYVQKNIDQDDDLETVGYYGYDPDGTHTNISSQKYTTGYFVKDFWIRNIGTSAVKVTPSITFKNANDTAASTATRGANPILNVAVLALEDLTDDNTDNPTWNLVQIFSNESENNTKVISSIKYSDDVADFADGAVVSGSVGDLSTIALANSGSTKTSGLQAPAIAADGATTYYPVQFRVVAWYDGDGLNNTTAAAATLKIDLSFAATAN